MDGNLSLARIRQCQTCHADAAMTKLPHPVTGATRFVLTGPSLCATRSASTPGEAVARWNAEQKIACWRGRRSA